MFLIVSQHISMKFPSISSISQVPLRSFQMPLVALVSRESLKRKKYFFSCDGE